MSTSYIGVNSVSGTTGSMAVNIPSGTIVAGDIIIAWVGVYGTSQPVISNPDANWNTIGSDIQPTANLTYRRAWKVFNESDSSYTFTSTNQSRFFVEVTAWHGVDNTTPIHKVNQASAASGTTITVTTQTTTIAGCMGVCLCGAYYTTTRTFSAESWATLGAITAEPVDTGNRVSGAVGYKQQAAAGATGDFTATISSTTSGWAGCFLMLAPGPYIKNVAANSSFTTTRINQPKHLMDAGLASVGSRVSNIILSKVGALNHAANVATQKLAGTIQQALEAGINFVGIETGKAFKVLIGDFTSTGQIVKKLIGIIVSAFTSSADLITNKFGVPILKSLSAILSWKKKP